MPHYPCIAINPALELGRLILRGDCLMLSRWRTLPPFTRMWVLCGVVWIPFVILEVVLGIVLGGTSSWTTIWVSLVVIGAAASGTFWVLGVIRLVQFARIKRRESASNSN